MDEDGLIEQLLSAHRERSPQGEIRYCSAFYDLPADARERAFQLARMTRELEAAQDRDGLSTTARAVLSRIEPA